MYNKTFDHASHSAKTLKSWSKNWKISNHEKSWSRVSRKASRLCPQCALGREQRWGNRGFDHFSCTALVKPCVRYLTLVSKKIGQWRRLVAPLWNFFKHYGNSALIKSRWCKFKIFGHECHQSAPLSNFFKKLRIWRTALVQFVWKNLTVEPKHAQVRNCLCLEYGWIHV